MTVLKGERSTPLEICTGAWLHFVAFFEELVLKYFPSVSTSSYFSSRSIFLFVQIVHNYLWTVNNNSSFGLTFLPLGSRLATRFAIQRVLFLKIFLTYVQNPPFIFFFTNYIKVLTLDNGFSLYRQLHCQRIHGTKINNSISACLCIIIEVFILHCFKELFVQKRTFWKCSVSFVVHFQDFPFQFFSFFFFRKGEGFLFSSIHFVFRYTLHLIYYSSSFQKNYFSKDIVHTYNLILDSRNLYFLEIN